MKLLVWNIQQGGGPRRQHIADSILRHRPDIVALVEFVPSTSEPFLKALRDAGFEHQLSTTRNGFDYAVCALSRTPLVARSSGIPLLDESGLWLEVTAAAHDINLGILQAPTDRREMKSFLDAVVNRSARITDEKFLVAGDFNTGIPPEDGPLENFGDVDRFQALKNSGFTDLWRHFHRDLYVYTYVFPQNKKRYRIDHALASSGLLPRIRGCRYSHRERICGISDHSIVIVEIET